MELVTAVLGDHGQRPKDDYGTNILFFFPYKMDFQSIRRSYIVHIWLTNLHAIRNFSVVVNKDTF